MGFYREDHRPGRYERNVRERRFYLSRTDEYHNTKMVLLDKPGGVGQADKEYIVHGYKSIRQVPVEICRKIVLSHVVEKVFSREDIDRPTYDEEQQINGGGTQYTTRWGNVLWFWTIQEPYMGIPESGPIIVYMSSLDEKGVVIKEIEVASVGIKPTNGIVHSLPYKYNLGEMYRDKSWAIINQ